MIIDIDKIIVKDRIRKDFGDIQELAEDIKVNGLINPPVVNKNYELLAGERRLRACKSLGWKQIEIHMMDTRDAEHELNVEISENETRKAFSKSERVDYMRRLLRIEQAKAEERAKAGTHAANATGVGRADELTAGKFDTSARTMRKEIAISDNRDLLTPTDFADWDEGRLSTNKAFQKVKAALAEKEERIKELEAGGNLPGMRETFYKNRIKTLEEKEDKLKKEVTKLEGENWSLEHDLTELRASLPDENEDPATEAAIKEKALEFAKADLASMAKKYDGLIDFAEFLTEYARSMSK